MSPPPRGEAPRSLYDLRVGRGGPAHEHLYFTKCFNIYNYSVPVQEQFFSPYMCGDLPGAVVVRLLRAQVHKEGEDTLRSKGIRDSVSWKRRFGESR